MLNKKLWCSEISLAMTAALLLGPVEFMRAESDGRQGRDQGGNVIKLKKGKATVKGDMKGEEDSYTVELKKGQAYIISMFAKFDTYLRIRDKTGNEIAKDDDGGPGLNSMLVLRPTENAPYKIVATSFGKDGRGPYILNVSTLPKIVLKDGRFSTKGNLKTTADLFSLDVKQGERYVISMNAEFDTYLVVLNADKKLIAKDDDGGEGLNSRLVFNPPAGGTYLIVATSFGGARRGEYQLSVVRENE